MTHPRHIIITGASSGIGQALALHYATTGIRLGLSGRDTTRLEAVAAACRAKGATVETARIDVTDREGMATWLMAADKTQPVDLLVANAGVGGGGALEPSAASYKAAEDMFDINIGGVANTLHPLLPYMARRGHGQVAILASLAGYRGLSGAPAYSASKGFAKLYGEGLRGALAPYGVRVNVICPGFVESRITAQNKFRMPFFMRADKAARVIAKGLEQNRPRIAFPWPMACMVWLMACLPARLGDWLVRQLPSKS